MKATNQDNLKALIKLMKELPNDQLDMQDWTCGTAACVGGWVAQMPEFHAIGGKRCFNGSPEIHDLMSPAVCWGSGAVARFIGVSRRDAADLCHGRYSEELDDDVWCIRPDIPFTEVKPSDVVEVLEQWLD